MLKSFAPLKIKFSLEGGYLMDYKIEKKEAFKVIANKKTFAYENAKEVVPGFWQEHYQTGKGKTQSNPTNFYDLDAIISVDYRVNSIRASERRIWQQVPDIFAECSIDYDKKAEILVRQL